ncbi:hypothetical protein [Aquimarina sp. 2201CG14-23]|uniref:hypothetical protein n=1 Tax=Aquimarina mycalae TaxID=3040073 RepID=UPI0024781BD7|nr:hypothetical protein [Aquimarina sp. 2201CG14-23]MDH7444697.1 hypothetical protein [Aquimarina sp. 2201CG14-23]
MKIKSYIFVIIICILFSNCSNDETVPVTTIVPKSIAFVKQDGTAISLFDCINPNENYAIMIRVDGEGEGEVRTTTVEYTINGIIYSMTFNKIESQLNQITLAEGENIAQLVDTGFIAKITYITAPAEFELVE